MIRFRCPYCDRQRKAKDARAGERMTCPDCEEEIRVPKRRDDGDPSGRKSGDPWFEVGLIVMLFLILVAIIKYR
jgi:hypothetical protein